jgi:Tfp pilus assembly protein PilF
MAQISRGDLKRALALLESGDWQSAHEIVQRDEDSPLACWAHGIVHLMEGDKSNARYWYRQAKREFPREPAPRDEIRALSGALEG